MATHANHKVQPIPIDIADRQRWTNIARRAVETSPALLIELQDLAGVPTRHRLGRATKAARWTAGVTVEPLKTELYALADEFEDLTR